MLSVRNSTHLTYNKSMHFKDYSPISIDVEEMSNGSVLSDLV